LGWTDHVAKIGKKLLVGKPGGKRPFKRPRRRRAYNIGMSFREIGCEGEYWLRIFPTTGCGIWGVEGLGSGYQ
jgi:hypothetical protein